MIAVAAHFPTLQAAAAAAQWLEPLCASSEPEEVRWDPVRAWVLVLYLKVRGGQGAEPSAALSEELRRAVWGHGGIVDGARLENGGVFNRITTPLPGAVLEQYYLDNPHLRPTLDRTPARGRQFALPFLTVDARASRGR